MTYEEKFLRDFEEWVQTQIQVNQLAMTTSRQIAQEDGDERAKDAFIRYESKLDAYQFLQGKFENYRHGKDFHDVPDDLFASKNY
ncbi:DUF1912 family protein [Streptococcus parauberis]|uniref:DUF1912 family protein n=3 Tax=Streptococcus parauberis TaxID=1348 RepID=A0A0E2UE88_9STRE|nr:DUF1912 family protein [Streptococcus parauberis]AEF25629.1 hypothetical protein STP_1181 [Streptococcus parauberis KCTC 11537]AUT06584.1 Aldose 1-epimerase [Streptococcus parauberis]EGE53836.1 hypothetical protein SPB_1054 [Streptococcus parauberis NCFD 2020]EMF50313.1 hypothetical protein SPJ2_1133 [Streptococcus parauberis KRS-02109]EMG25292.1 hypothetical protein SPJ1_1396 [Streptococcus parauberis KRS-02083]